MLSMIDCGKILSQFSLAATSSTLFSSPWSMMSWNCFDVLNCAAVGGSPPMMRLIAVERAWSAPATAWSIHKPPALLYASANCLMAADSPPDVHQWITVAFNGSACAALLAAIAAMTLTTSFFMLFIESPPGYVFLLALRSIPSNTGPNGFGVEIELRVRRGRRPWRCALQGTSQPVPRYVSWCV